MKKTTVVNIGMVNMSDPDIRRIDRKTPFGNPFRIGPDGDRETVVAKHRRYLIKRCEVDSKFKKAVERLRGHKLACWCSPLPCHGNNYVEYLEGQ